MVLYRVTYSRYANDISGEGARRNKGRWNPEGVPMVYTSSSVALAAIECFVNTPSDIVSLMDFKRVDIYVPDDAAVEYIEIQDIPSDWQRTPAPEYLADIGQKWIEACNSLLLRVPSAALGGHEFNFLINPRHPRMNDVNISGLLPFDYDQRLLTTPRNSNHS